MYIAFSLWDEYCIGETNERLVNYRMEISKKLKTISMG